MSSNLIRPGMVVGLAILFGGAIALAQDRGSAQPAAQGPVDVFNPIEGRMVIVTSRPDRALVIAAPAGGRIEYAAPIGAGAVVHDGQLLFRIVTGRTANTEAK
jgi:hypothetical protein